MYHQAIIRNMTKNTQIFITSLTACFIFKIKILKKICTMTMRLITCHVISYLSNIVTHDFFYIANFRKEILHALKCLNTTPAVVTGIKKL